MVTQAAYYRLEAGLDKPLAPKKNQIQREVH